MKTIIGMSLLVVAVAVIFKILLKDKPILEVMKEEERDEVNQANMASNMNLEIHQHTIDEHTHMQHQNTDHQI